MTIESQLLTQMEVLDVMIKNRLIN